MVNIDTVYQRVLALANKEQRGYITPQDFNLFANHAQMEIFEQYFHDKDQFERDPRSYIVELLDQKIQIFKQGEVVVVHGDILPLNTYQVDSVHIRFPGEKRRPVQRIDKNEVAGIKSGPLLRPCFGSYYYIYNNTIYFVDPATPGDFRMGLIRRPARVNWGYVVMNNQAMYNQGSSTQFELHSSEETELVNKILRLAGISIKQPDIMSAGQGMDTVTIQQQKQ